MALMVIYFLQLKKLLPAIALLQVDESSSAKQCVGRECCLITNNFVYFP